MCLDAAAAQFGSVAAVAPKYNLEFGRHNQKWAKVLGAADPSPQVLLDSLARHCLASAYTPTSLTTSCISLAHHAHLQFTKVGFLNDVMTAAGKLGTPSSKESARRSLTEWVGTNPVATRNILGHAAILICLLDRYRFE
jgi:hypothetical protein